MSVSLLRKFCVAYCLALINLSGRFHSALSIFFVCVRLQAAHAALMEAQFVCRNRASTAATSVLSAPAKRTLSSAVALAADDPSRVSSSSAAAAGGTKHDEDEHDDSTMPWAQLHASLVNAIGKQAHTQFQVQPSSVLPEFFCVYVICVVSTLSRVFLSFNEQDLGDPIMALCILQTRRSQMIQQRRQVLYEMCRAEMQRLLQGMPAVIFLLHSEVDIFPSHSNV